MEEFKLTTPTYRKTPSQGLRKKKNQTWEGGYNAPPRENAAKEMKVKGVYESSPFLLVLYGCDAGVV